MDEGDFSLASDVLTEFLEIAFHSILYLRGVYPKQIFELRKKYQVPIRVSKHPKVNEYLEECLKTVKELLLSDAVDEVALVVSEDDVPLEKFVFGVKPFPSREGNSLERLVLTEEVFREFLLKLTAILSGSDPVPEDSAFSIQITTNEESYVRMNEMTNHSEFPWIESDPVPDRNQRITPVKFVNCPFFEMNAYVER